MAKSNTIITRRHSGGGGYDEAVAAAVLSPGHVIELTAAGTVQKRAAAAGELAGAYIAVEMEMQGREITEAYAAGELVQLHHIQSGERCLVYLKAEQNVAIGDVLEGALAGEVQAVTTGKAEFVVREAADLTGGVATLIEVERI